MRWSLILLLSFVAACSGSGGEVPLGHPDAATLDSGEPDLGLRRDAAADPDASPPSDAGQEDAATPDAATPDATEPDATEPDATEPDGDTTPDADSTPDADVTPDADTTPDAAEPDAGKADAGTACDSNPCFPGVTCAVPSLGGFECGACPTGYAGDGVSCEDLDACAVAPCLAGTSCTDLPVPNLGYTCSPCVGLACPILRALAGPDQATLAGAVILLEGSATGNNGEVTCQWTNDQTGSVIPTCTTTVAVTAETVFELMVTDASGGVATDDLVVRVVELVAEAGPDHNALLGDEVTLVGSWTGASCPNGSCVACTWRRPDDSVLATTCTTTVSAPYTSQYSLTVTDSAAGSSATDSTTVYVTDAPANLCGWDVVVMTSDEYPSTPNPNYTCTPDGRARRQTVNGKPSLVMSDLVIQNVKIIGYIGVETSADDDHIGFLWGFENPAHTYLLSWKQLNQNWTAACGNAPAGVAVKKIDGALGAPTTISFKPSFGFNGTDYVYSCADGWSTDRADQGKLSDGSVFLLSPRDQGAYVGGWRDFVTYRFEIFHTPNRSKVMIFEDDTRSGTSTTLVTELEVVDSSYPRGRVAFFSNSQEQVDFGDFTFASLDGFAADAGIDQAASSGSMITLEGAAVLAVPPFACEWSAGGVSFSSDCTTTVTPMQSSTYALTVTDAFGRVAVDEVAVIVIP